MGLLPAVKSRVSGLKVHDEPSNDTQILFGLEGFRGGP